MASTESISAFIVAMIDGQRMRLAPPRTSITAVEMEALVIDYAHLAGGADATGEWL